MTGSAVGLGRMFRLEAQRTKNPKSPAPVSEWASRNKTPRVVGLAEMRSAAQ